MEINYTLSFWDSLFALVGIIISSIVAFWIYKLSKQLSIREKYEHELKITNEIQKLRDFSEVILADAKKYHTAETDPSNQSYRKQRAEIYTVMPAYGVQVILMPSDERIPVGHIPFEWIKFVRSHDNEDWKPIIVCDFKGVKYYRNFKSPFSEIQHLYKNPNYKEGEPNFMFLTHIKPQSVSQEGS